MKTDLDLAFKVNASHTVLEGRVERLQAQLAKRETPDVYDIDLTANFKTRTVIIHMVVKGRSDAQVLTRALGVVVPAIFAIGDVVVFGQSRKAAPKSAEIWQPDLELAAVG
ncbi:MAG: hypothetical protein HZA58_08625 [Acidimicrobiia bacterium]|nr:hypothetical protein [Acidimicrobiia bacterium]